MQTFNGKLKVVITATVNRSQHLQLSLLKCIAKLRSLCFVPVESTKHSLVFEETYSKTFLSWTTGKVVKTKKATVASSESTHVQVSLSQGDITFLLLTLTCSLRCKRTMLCFDNNHTVNLRGGGNSHIKWKEMFLLR